ncbi:MAG: cytochrome c oxidase subunit II [Halobacteriaceae archaeon]
MEIHRFEKIWVAVALLLIIGFIATVTYGAVGIGIKMVDDSGGTVNQQAIGNGNFDQTDFRAPGVYKRDGTANHYDVYVVARQFFFQPGTNQPIRVPAGSTVTLHVTSGDVIHGFEVVGTNVNTMAIPGQVSTMTVRFDRPAQYGLLCNEYCGTGHHTMSGSLQVVPQSEFNATEA